MRHLRRVLREVQRALLDKKNVEGAVQAAGKSAIRLQPYQGQRLPKVCRSVYRILDEVSSWMRVYVEWVISRMRLGSNEAPQSYLNGSAVEWKQSTLATCSLTTDVWILLLVP